MMSSITCFDVLPLGDPSFSILSTISWPDTTEPNTVCLPACVNIVQYANNDMLKLVSLLACMLQIVYVRRSIQETSVMAFSYTIMKGTYY
jgi:hypothetical protein